MNPAYTSYEESICLSNVLSKTAKFSLILMEQLYFIGSSPEEIIKYSEQILIPTVSEWED